MYAFSDPNESVEQYMKLKSMQSLSTWAAAEFEINVLAAASLYSGQQYMFLHYQEHPTNYKWLKHSPIVLTKDYNDRHQGESINISNHLEIVKKRYDIYAYRLCDHMTHI